MNALASHIAPMLPGHVVPAPDLVVLDIEVGGDAFGFDIAFVDVIAHRFRVGPPILVEIDRKDFTDAGVKWGLSLRIVLAQLEDAAGIAGRRRQLAEIGKARQELRYFATQKVFRPALRKRWLVCSNRQ
jgi:hypothetical protein